MAVLDPFDYVSQGDWDGLRAALESEPALAEARDENGLSLLIMSLYHRRTDVAARIEALRPAFDLFEASALGRAEDVARHLEDGADLTALTPDGFTALHLAAFFDRPEVAEKLLEAGATAAVAAKNPSRVQPIHSAVAGKSAEVIDLRSLRPMDTETVVNSVRKTNRCVTIEEGWPVCSIGNHLSAVLMQEAFDYLDAPVINCTGKDVPMPYAANLEKLALITTPEVIAAAKAVCYR